MKRWIKQKLAYTPLTDTESVRAALEPLRADTSLPACPPWQGDLIHETLTDISAADCLEIGFHTGSTALYMLNALRAGGSVTSIEPMPEGIRGFATVAAFDAGAAHHAVLEGFSHDLLPRLMGDDRRFDFVFVDGWKTFDALAVDCYYASRLLRTGGVLFLDDHHMPSVRRAARMLVSHYNYVRMRPLPRQTGRSFRLWLALTGRSPHMPFVRLRKTLDEADTPAGRDWNFHRRI